MIIWCMLRLADWDKIMSQNMRRVVQFLCGILLVAGVGLVAWMAYRVSGNDLDALRDWNSLYDYIVVGCVVLVCVILATIADGSGRGLRTTLVSTGGLLLLSGAVGYQGFEYLRNESLVTQVLPKIRLKPNAAETVLGYHYVCPISGGYVAFGDGSVRYVDPEQFESLRHAETPDYAPEFHSPKKQATLDDKNVNADEKKGDSELGLAVKDAGLVQERIEHSNNLKRMAEDHFNFLPQGSVRRPLKPEHFRSYPGMSDELRTSIKDGTYVWYFGWDPIDSNYYMESEAYEYGTTKALWYQFASWASIYFAGYGLGSLFAGLILVIKSRNHTLARRNERS